MQRSKSTPNIFSTIDSSRSSNKQTRYIHGYTPIDKIRKLHENTHCYTVLSNVECQIETLETLINDTMCVKEIYRFRFDKDKIWVYKCDKSLPFDISKAPKCPLDAPSYSHDWLPDKYWPMYLNACQFMTRVRSETPKITIYTPTSKAVLYDFPGLYEVLFFADSTRVIFSNGIRIVKSTGDEFNVTDINSHIIPDEIKSLLDEASKIYDVIKKFEFNENFFNLSQRNSIYPVIIGEEPFKCPN